ncbi:hypothetical protein [Pendulispora albinea]|uniref:Uncharacterized protein n=1 Tax=Pendulispora albinea TaxID=2741071 RepID=A0ABZ2LU46_9BACT
MSESREPKVASSSSWAERLRFLALGIIIGASTVVLVTERDVSSSAANLVQKAMPDTTGMSAPAAILSTILPPSPPPPSGAGSAEPPRIPVIDAERLPKAENAPAASAKHAKAKKKGEGDDDRKGAPAGPSPIDESSQLGPTIEQLLQGMQGGGLGKVFDDK